MAVDRARESDVEARRGAIVGVGLLTVCVLLRGAQAIPLEDRIPHLFGGTLATSITPFDATVSRLCN